MTSPLEYCAIRIDGVWVPFRLGAQASTSPPPPPLDPTPSPPGWGCRGGGREGRPSIENLGELPASEPGAVSPQAPREA